RGLSPENQQATGPWRAKLNCSIELLPESIWDRRCEPATAPGWPSPAERSPWASKPDRWKLNRPSQGGSARVATIFPAAGEPAPARPVTRDNDSFFIRWRGSREVGGDPEREALA